MTNEQLEKRVAELELQLVARNVEDRLVIVERENAIQQARTDERRKVLEEAIAVALGCKDYGGGYRGNTEMYEAYHHGMETVANALRARMERPSDYQAQVVLAIGREELATLKEHQQQELADLRKDKARLDWLEQKAHSTRIGLDLEGSNPDSFVVRDCGWFEDYSDAGEGTTLREAIDAAMK